MRVISLLMWCSLTLVSAVLTAGCGAPPAPPPAASQSDTGGEAADEPAGLAELSAADLELARRQATCPVSGQPLGSMGTPPRVTVEGREFFLCCESCSEALHSDPAKYIAKLPPSE